MLQLEISQMVIYIKVKPKFYKERVEKIDESHFIVCTQKIPEKGKANNDVIRILAKYFQISPSRVIITSGFTSKNKTVTVITQP